MRPSPGVRSPVVASLVASLVALVTLAALAVTAAAQPRPAHVTARDRWMTAVRFNEKFVFDAGSPAKIDQADAAIRKQPLLAVPIGSDAAWTWRIRRDLAGVPHQICAAAALNDAVSLWLWFDDNGLGARPFEVMVDCASRAWVRVAVKRAGPAGGHDTLRLERSFGGDAELALEAPLELTASDQSAKLARGREHEQAWLAAQAYHEIVERRPPLALRRDVSDAAAVSWTMLDCGPGGFGYAGADELCTGRVSTTDGNALVSAALWQFLRLATDRGARGPARDHLPARWLFVHGGSREWALVRTTGPDTLEVVLVRSWILRDRQEVPLRVDARRLGTLAASPAPAGASLSGGGAERMALLRDAAAFAPSAPTEQARLAWYAERAGFAARALGAIPAAVPSAADVGAALDGVRRGGKRTLTCQPGKRKDPRYCQVLVAQELEAPACASIAWAVAGALPHVRKPPWKPREDVELSVACGQRDGRPMLAVRRRPIDARRVEITVDVGPPMIAPIDPSKP